MASLLAEFDTAHCGVIHDAQLDYYGQCLATASADGHVRLWDVRKPQDPGLLCDLGHHAGAVYQVSWAPPDTGMLLASVGGDGRVIIWGQRTRPDEWHVVHTEDLQRHGPVRAVSWAPAERGASLACASADGSATILVHAGVVADECTVEHRWRAQSFQAHCGQANAVSWAAPRGTPGIPLGFDGARLATAGDDGVRAWSRNEEKSRWEPEAMDISKESKAFSRDVVWKSWDGICEMLASATQQAVVIWRFEEAAEGGSRSWRAAQRVPIGEEVWKLSWTDLGGMLLVSCGEEQRTMLMKQQLGGEWDVMDMIVTQKGG